MEQTPKLGSYEEWEAWMVASSLEGKNDQASSSVEDGIKNFMKEDDPRPGGILAGKWARILPGSLELSGEVLSKNHALLSQF